MWQETRPGTRAGKLQDHQQSIEAEAQTWVLRTWRCQLLRRQDSFIKINVLQELIKEPLTPQLPLFFC